MRETASRPNPIESQEEAAKSVSNPQIVPFLFLIGARVAIVKFCIIHPAPKVPQYMMLSQMHAQNKLFFSSSSFPLSKKSMEKLSE